MAEGVELLPFLVRLKQFGLAKDDFGLGSSDFESSLTGLFPVLKFSTCLLLSYIE